MAPTVAKRAEHEWIAANVRRLRIKKGWPQDRLAEEMGLSIRAVSLIERARTDMQISTFLRLAEALGVPALQLLKKPKVLNVRTMPTGPKAKRPS